MVGIIALPNLASVNRKWPLPSSRLITTLYDQKNRLCKLPYTKQRESERGHVSCIRLRTRTENTCPRASHTRSKPRPPKGVRGSRVKLTLMVGNGATGYEGRSPSRCLSGRQNTECRLRLCPAARSLHSGPGGSVRAAAAAAEYCSSEPMTSSLCSSVIV